jgi:hypothetical protein
MEGFSFVTPVTGLNRPLILERKMMMKNPQNAFAIVDSRIRAMAPKIRF